MKSITRIVSCAAVVAAIAHPLPAAAVTTDLSVGDTVQLIYAFGSPTSVFGTNTTTFTYTGAGQTVSTQSGLTTLDFVSNSQIQYSDCTSGCSQNSAAFNGPVLFDLSNSNAFSNWSILSSNPSGGTVSLLLAAGEIGVNWQGVSWPAGGGDVTLGVSATPLPAAFPLFAGGLGVVALLARRKKRRALSALVAA